MHKPITVTVRPGKRPLMELTEEAIKDLGIDTRDVYEIVKVNRTKASQLSSVLLAPIRHESRKTPLSK